MTRPVILNLLGCYWPGNDSSGPNTSFRSMATELGADFEFLMVARDLPLGADAASVTPPAQDRWHDIGFARARYLPIGRRGAQGLGALLDATPHDVLHLNGYHDREFTIPALVRRRLRRPSQGVLLSPRGEFSDEALGLGALKKQVYRAVANGAGLLNNVVLHATSDAELADLRRAFPRHRIELIPNARAIFPLPAAVARRADERFRIAFVGRISPVKGVDIALRALAQVRAPVRFEIYGPVQDADYWRSCTALIAALPSHVEVVAMGEIANSAVAETMARQDLMLMPSLSENFGHGIFESLAAGTPVVIGDKTPWRDLAARRAGFDLPLADVSALAAAIDRLAAMDAATAQQWRDGARAVAEGFVAASPALAQMRALYHELAGGR
ncbi:glycosyltransferase family 4 protein [Sphingomonas sp.]|uniref:glycosyltransferase family 4 protein n=1 Tax=Sphingomonas sp. TaxID=28214 RepID=UPI002E0D574B|nr:glycosyltransferase family 4 protein [Sphingomonas sp.]